MDKPINKSRRDTALPFPIVVMRIFILNYKRCNGTDAVLVCERPIILCSEQYYCFFREDILHVPIKYYSFARGSITALTKE